MSGIHLKIVKVYLPVALLIIGIIAGCVAISITLKTSTLSPEKDAGVSCFSLSLLAGAVVFLFTALIGLLVFIMEYKIPISQNDKLLSSFFTLEQITGSLNINENKTYQITNELPQELRHIDDIDILSDFTETIPIDSPSKENEEQGDDVFSFYLKCLCE